MICTKTLPTVILTIKSEDIGDDLLVTLTGGKTHIGSVSMAIYNKEDGKASVSTVAAPDHRENEISSKGALYLSEKLKKNVVLTAGIHVDNPTERELEDIVKGCKDIIIVFGHNYE